MKIIVAANILNVIGRDGEIPWFIQEDLTHFYNLTVNNIVVMGRKTFESLGNKPLPKRQNIVLTHENRSSENKKNLCFVSNYEQAIHTIDQKWKNSPKSTVYVIGGGFVYDLFLKKGDVSEIILTQVWNKEPGDTFFRIPKGWRMQSEKELCEEATVYTYKKLPLKKVKNIKR